MSGTSTLILQLAAARVVSSNTTSISPVRKTTRYYNPGRPDLFMHGPHALVTNSCIRCFGSEQSRLPFVFNFADTRSSRPSTQSSILLRRNSDLKFPRESETVVYLTSRNYLVVRKKRHTSSHQPVSNERHGSLFAIVQLGRSMLSTDLFVLISYVSGAVIELIGTICHDVRDRKNHDHCYARILSEPSVLQCHKCCLFRGRCHQPTVRYASQTRTVT